MFSKQKSRPVPEAMLRSVQLTHGEKRYDNEDREIRHASKLWQYAAKCWHIENSLDCNQEWIDQDKHICFWCPQHAEARNQQADVDNIRWIPPKRHKALR